MALPTNIRELEYKKFIESLSVAGRVGVVALNPDGSSIGSMTGSSSSLTVHTVAYSASLIVAAPAYLLSVRGYSNRASLQIIQTHNSATLPANGVIPKEAIKVNALENFFIEPIRPVLYSSGIVVCNSSTLPTKTIGSADCWFTIEYILA